MPHTFRQIWKGGKAYPYPPPLPPPPPPPVAPADALDVPMGGTPAASPEHKAMPRGRAATASPASGVAPQSAATVPAKATTVRPPQPPPRLIAPPIGEVQRPPARRTLGKPPHHFYGIGKTRPSIVPEAKPPAKARGSVALAIMGTPYGSVDTSEPPSGSAASTPPATIPAPGTPPVPPSYGGSPPPGSLPPQLAAGVAEWMASGGPYQVPAQQPAGSATPQAAPPGAMRGLIIELLSLHQQIAETSTVVSATASDEDEDEVMPAALTEGEISAAALPFHVENADEAAPVNPAVAVFDSNMRHIVHNANLVAAEAADRMPTFATQVLTVDLTSRESRRDEVATPEAQLTGPERYNIFDSDDEEYESPEFDDETLLDFFFAQHLRTVDDIEELMSQATITEQQLEDIVSEIDPMASTGVAPQSAAADAEAPQLPATPPARDTSAMDVTVQTPGSAFAADWGGSPAAPTVRAVSPQSDASSPQRCAAAAPPEEQGFEPSGDAALATCLQQEEYQDVIAGTVDTGGACGSAGPAAQVIPRAVGPAPHLLAAAVARAAAASASAAAAPASPSAASPAVESKPEPSVSSGDDNASERLSPAKRIVRVSSDLAAQFPPKKVQRVTAAGHAKRFQNLSR